MSLTCVDESKESAVNTISFDSPDAALVAAAKLGDDLAFEILIKRYHGRIFAVALRYTRVREDSEDVVQQALQKAFLYLHTFEGKSSFSTWLTRITINEALMHLRHDHKRRELSLEDVSSANGPSFNLRLLDTNPDPEVKYSRRELAEIVASAIERLTPGIRVVLQLREFAELSSRETAQRLGLSISSVKARVFHGRKQLRKALHLQEGG